MKTIDTPEALVDASKTIARAPWAAIDCEADSLHHFLEKLCLLQISVPGEDFVIDPLVPLDLHPLVEILGQKPILAHGADFDVRILRRFYGFRPRKLFDTLLAAQLLGYDRQGYADLAERHCGMKLNKTAQKADWSKRPLTLDLIEYASNDTRYLEPIVDAMRKELGALGRLDWHRQSCERLLKTIHNLTESKGDPERDWQVKGSRDLKGLSLTILKQMWLWRDSEARRRDRPPFKVLNTDTLIDLARWSGEHPNDDVAKMPKAPSNVRGQLRERLNAIVLESRHLPQAQWMPAAKTGSSKRWGDRESSVLATLKTAREKAALELKVLPSLLATNASLEAVIVASPESREDLAALELLMPWQVEVLGDAIVEVSRELRENRKK